MCTICVCEYLRSKQAEDVKTMREEWKTTAVAGKELGKSKQQQRMKMSRNLYIYIYMLRDILVHFCVCMSIYLYMRAVFGRKKTIIHYYT